MHRIISHQSSFRVTLNVFGAKDEQTLFMHWQIAEPMVQLAKEMPVLNQYLQSNGCSDLQINKNPQMLMAIDLPKPIYQLTISQMVQQAKMGEMMISSLVLLRKQHAMDEIKQVNIFGLRP